MLPADAGAQGARLGFLLEVLVYVYRLLPVVYALLAVWCAAIVFAQYAKHRSLHRISNIMLLMLSVFCLLRVAGLAFSAGEEFVKLGRSGWWYNSLNLAPWVWFLAVSAVMVHHVVEILIGLSDAFEWTLPPRVGQSPQAAADEIARRGFSNESLSPTVCRQTHNRKWQVLRRTFSCATFVLCLALVATLALGATLEWEGQYSAMFSLGLEVPLVSASIIHGLCLSKIVKELARQDDIVRDRKGRFELACERDELRYREACALTPHTASVVLRSIRGVGCDLAVVVPPETPTPRHTTPSASSSLQPEPTWGCAIENEECLPPGVAAELYAGTGQRASGRARGGLSGAHRQPPTPLELGSPNDGRQRDPERPVGSLSDAGCQPPAPLELGSRRSESRVPKMCGVGPGDDTLSAEAQSIAALSESLPSATWAVGHIPLMSTAILPCALAFFVRAGCVVYLFHRGNLVWLASFQAVYYVLTEVVPVAMLMYLYNRRGIDSEIAAHRGRTWRRRPIDNTPFDVRGSSEERFHGIEGEVGSAGLVADGRRVGAA